MYVNFNLLKVQYTDIFLRLFKSYCELCQFEDFLKEIYFILWTKCTLYKQNTELLPLVMLNGCNLLLLDRQYYLVTQFLRHLGLDKF